MKEAARGGGYPDITPRLRWSGLLVSSFGSVNVESEYLAASAEQFPSIFLKLSPGKDPLELYLDFYTDTTRFVSSLETIQETM